VDFLILFKCILLIVLRLIWMTRRTCSASVFRIH